MSNREEAGMKHPANRGTGIASAKHRYSQPKLTVFGSVADLTRASGGSMADGHAAGAPQM